MLQALIHLTQLLKEYFIALKAEVDKLDINKLTNVPTSLKNLKTIVDDLFVGKLKTVPVDLKKLIDVVDNEVLKNTKFNILKAKVKSLEKKVSDAVTLTYINRYNTDKKNLEKKLDILKKIPDTSELLLFRIQKLVKLRTKYQCQQISDYKYFEYKDQGS